MNKRHSTSVTPRTQEASKRLALAIAAHRAGDCIAAESLYRAALASDSRNADALQLLGTLYAQQGRPEKGIRLMKKALAVNPGHADACYNCAKALELLHTYKEALAYYDKAIALRADYAEAHHNRGVTLYKMGEYDKALISLDLALALKPGFTDAHYDRGVVLQAQNRHEEAILSYDKAIAINPSHADAYNNRGVVLQAQNRHEEAILSYDKAIAVNPSHADAYNNRGVVLQAQNRHEEAILSYDKAIAINPSHADACYNKGVSKLTLGKLAEGWQLYEWRWKSVHKIDLETLEKPLWLGKASPAGKTVLLHAEQGLGDTIQLCRYIPLVEALGAEVLFAVRSPLAGLMSTLSGQFHLITEKDTPPDYDVRCPLFSLPLAFGTTLETIPADVPYLHADPQKREIWESRLGDKTRPRVGLAWSGAERHKNDHNRSLPLQCLAPLLGCDCDFHALQKDIRPQDAATLALDNRIAFYGEDLQDFTDTAALTAEMDVVVSVDTSVAHLAGALGKPVWILLPFAADYRWMLDREDSPWYPTARLFRQPRAGDWESIIARVKDALKHYVHFLNGKRSLVR